MITGKNAELYFGESVYKQMNIEVVGTGIVIDNSMREQDTFTLTETLCDSSELKFGSCLPNQISFVGREIPASIKGKRLHPVEILEGNEDDPFEYGTYTVYSDVPTSDRTKRQITAYDAMYDIINADVKSWYAGLTFPMTLKAFRDSFFAHLGIAQKETTLVNDGITINKTMNTESSSDSNVTEVESISGKTVVEAICEINGVFGNINRDGLFEYVEIKPIINPLYPANDLYPADDLFPRDPNTISMTGHYITFDYEDFQSKAITQLEIRPSDDSAGVIVGTSGNNYVISGNFLVSDKSGTELEAIAENTLSVIKQASYTPIKSCSCVGNPCLELGDPIRFNTSREIVESYVLQRTLTGIQSKRDSITSLGTETHSAKVNSIKDTISNVEKRTNKLERTSDHTLSEISNLDERTSTKFEQTASQIQAEITRATGEESTLRSTITQTAEEISSEISNRKSADNEMSSKIEQTAELISTEVTNRQNADNEMSSKIEQTASGITQTVSESYSTKEETANGLSNLDLKAKGYADTAESNANISTDKKLENYPTTVEMNSTVEQTASSFSIELSKKVGGDEVRSKFAMSSEDVTISSGTIKFESDTLIIDSTGCKLDKNGNFFILNALKMYDGDSITNVFDYDGKHTLLMHSTVIGNTCKLRRSGVDYDIAVKNDIPSLDDYVKKTDVPGLINGNDSLYGLRSSYTGYLIPTSNIHRMATTSSALSVRSDNGLMSISASSDSKLKHDIFDSRINALEKVMQIVHREFYWNDSNEYQDNGYIAQELEPIDKSMVIVDRDEYGTPWYSINTVYMISLCTKAIQEQHQEIEQLKQENLALQNRLSILEQKMEVLENAYNNKNN